MEKSYQKLITGNKIYSETKLFQDPEYFKKMAEGQKPDYLWIGCSDSRVPANEITKTGSGEMFVHRNIANLVVHTDANMLSVLEYAVKHLGVKHIIVCGHYGCGGVKAAMTNTSHGFVDNWLCNIKDVYHQNSKELEAIKDDTERTNRLTELNVIEQVRNLAKTSIVQEAWRKRDLHLHAWVYGLHNGLIKDLAIIHNKNKDIDPIYRLHTTPANKEKKVLVPVLKNGGIKIPAIKKDTSKKRLGIAAGAKNIKSK
jgi:carbonic anhydrase